MSDKCVSIHLMLQFIVLNGYMRLIKLEFQYISCCSLSVPIYATANIMNQFQYISCCSLSGKNIPECMAELGFNTSHVVVYQELSVLLWGLDTEFQYISCCSLSVLSFVILTGNTMVSIHLMLQFITVRRLSGQKIRFNTSHVVVYPISHHFSVICVRVSIHLMLQFIQHQDDATFLKFGFNTSHVVVYRNGKG